MKRLQTIQWHVCRHLRSRFEMVEPKPQQGLFNFKCFHNCAEWCRTRPEFGVCEVIYIEAGVPILHYLVTLDGEYYEVTLGYLAEQLEYYKIRDIHPNDLPNIGSEFSRARDDWRHQFTNWFDRYILRIGHII